MKILSGIPLLILILLLTMTRHLLAQEKSTDVFHDMTLLDTGIVEKIMKPDAILLEGGKAYRLENIRIPTGQSAAAAEVLSNLVLNKKLRIYSTHKKSPLTDRYGLPLVHIQRPDGLWVQSYLVSKGLAWAFSTKTSRETVSTLKQIETQAREKHLGFWVDPVYAIKTPDNVQDFMNSFQIVQGKVASVMRKRDYTYINFGLDWKTDFTVNIKNSVWRLFDTGPQIWTGKTIRIRGWVESRNGPMINLTHPEQVEILN